MKKIGVLIILLAVFIFAINFVNAVNVIGSLDNFKADKISGYACDRDNNEAGIQIQLIFTNKLNHQESKIVTANIPSDPTINALCNNPNNNGNYNFSFNIYEDPILLNWILSNFPVTVSTNIDTRSSNLDFSCIYPDQTIMKLSKPFNAHVYPAESTLKDSYPICYERIFGYPYEGSSPIYSSSCDSPVLYKHKSENTHVASTSVTGYTNKLCYADLKCTPRTTCNPGEKPIVSLFRAENTHASDSIDSNYPIKMCCTTDYIPNPINEAKWYNMLAEQITSADKCDWTQLGAWGASLVDQNVKFNIKNSEEQVVFTQDKLIPLFNSPQIAWQTPGGDTFYFDALLISNSDLNKTSEDLIVSDNINTAEYNITLITPKCGNNFSINTDINFNIFMNTTKILLDGRISFGDGINRTFSNQGSSIAIFTHRYDSDGTKKVIIETWPVTNQISSCPDISYMKKRKIINIMVIDPDRSGAYTAACIDSPEDMSKINKQEVFCNASSTRAINYSTTTGYTLIPHTNLSFNWTFSDRTIHEFRSIQNLINLNQPCYDTIHNYLNPSGELYSHTISCDINANGWTFTKYFQTAGDHYADLRVDIV